MPLLRSSRHRRKPKGPIARSRASRKRKDDAYALKIRALCVIRDGECRICDWENNPDDLHTEDCHPDEGGMPYPEDCSFNPSQWAHVRGTTRAETRGMKPEERHTTAGTLMLCEFHHDRYDGRKRPRIHIAAMTELGADGPLEFS